MGISSDMVKLAESISAAYEERKKAAEDRLQELENFRKEMHDKLVLLEKQRMENREDLLGDLHVFSENLKNSVKGMRDAFEADHREKSAGQAKMLQEFHSALSDSVKEMRDAFGVDHREKSAEQAKMLQEFRSALSDSVDKLIDALGADRSERSAEQARTLQEFHSALSNSVEKMLHVFSADHQKMKKAQGESLAALMNELRQSSEALRNVQKGDSGKAVSRAAKAKQRKVEPEKAPVVAEQEEASAMEAGSLVQTVEEKAVAVSEDLEGQVLEYISNRPEGVRVGDMEEPLGANRMRLGVIAKKLYESNKVRKEENLYLPL